MVADYCCLWSGPLWFSFALVSDAIELSSSFHHIWRLFVLDCDLDLDMYVAGPFSIYATGRELDMNVSPMRNSFPEAVHCLSTHNTFFKMVPVNYRPWEKRVFEQFGVTLHGLKAFAIVRGLPIYNMFGYTVCKLL